MYMGALQKRSDRSPKWLGLGAYKLFLTEDDKLCRSDKKKERSVNF